MSTAPHPVRNSNLGWHQSSEPAARGRDAGGDGFILLHQIRVWVVSGLFFGGCFLPVRGFAQDFVVPTYELRPATAVLAEEFSRIISVRELSDGRVLIGDRLEARVVLADFVSGLVTMVGRQGMGPGEYPAVGRFLPLGGDSTLMVDRTSRRWLLFVNGGTVNWLSADSPAFRVTNGVVLGADAGGHLLSSQSTSVEHMPRGSSMLDSTALILVDAASGKVRPVTKIKPLPTMFDVTGEVGSMPESITIGFQQLGAGEEPFLFPDGVLAIARLDPYRVDWRAADGRWSYGKALPFRLVRVDDREKQWFRARRAAITPSRRVGRERYEARWAEFIPPFLSPWNEIPTLLGLPDGHLLIARAQSADHPENRYDVIDRTGRLIMRLTLPSSERIAGAGPRGLYVVSANEDGLEMIRRHPLP